MVRTCLFPQVSRECFMSVEQVLDNVESKDIILGEEPHRGRGDPQRITNVAKAELALDSWEDELAV